MFSPIPPINRLEKAISKITFLYFREEQKVKGDAVMRIDAYNQVAAIYKSSKPVRMDSAKKAAGFQDQLQISQAGRDYQIAKQAVANASDIREDKVAELKAKVDSGNYKVDVGDFASKLLEKYNELY